MISLTDKKEIWRNMPEDTPEQQLWADNYYDAELMPMAQAHFKNHYAAEKGLLRTVSAHGFCLGAFDFYGCSL